MPKANFQSRRNYAASALRSLGNLLIRNNICYDISPLARAAEQMADGRTNDNRWHYQISDLAFNISQPAKIMPASAKQFTIQMSLELSGRFDSDPVDQFDSMEINVEKHALSASGEPLKTAWHFDRHIIDTEKNDPHVTADIHPLYHFQFGGARMEGISERLGDTFLVAPPRLMHPPMDGILAVDFILANYDGNIWKSLRDDNQYANLVNSRLESIWEPYFEAIAGSWQNPRNPLSSFLCPSVIR